MKYVILSLFFAYSLYSSERQLLINEDTGQLQKKERSFCSYCFEGTPRVVRNLGICSFAVGLITKGLQFAQASYCSPEITPQEICKSLWVPSCHCSNSYECCTNTLNNTCTAATVAGPFICCLGRAWESCQKQKRDRQTLLDMNDY